ncbi:hypothetical protein EON82_05185 [bacterium]|nr:MAG: hypothetical protein EON82_05185 [bacterium]
MTETANGTIRNAALALVVGGAVVAIGLAWNRYGGLDPYSSVMKKARPSNPAASIQASGVNIRHYENGKLVAQADAKGLTIDQNRSGVVLDKVKNGVLQSQEGPMQFAAGTGVLRPNLKMVDVSNGVRVKGRDFDVTTSTASLDGRRGELKVPNAMSGSMTTTHGPMQFTAGTGILRPGPRTADIANGVRVKGTDFDVVSTVANLDGRKGQIKMPQPLKGRIMGGDFAAASMVHRPGANYTHLKSPSYVGKLPKPLTVNLPGATQDRIWDMAADDYEGIGRKETFTNARAQDGEIIVMAPKIERDLKNDVLTATGRATYRSAKADMIADKVIVYRKEGRAEFIGNVVMLVRPKKDWDKPLPKEPIAVDSSGAPELKSVSPAEKERDEALRSGKTLRDYPMNMKSDTVSYWYRKGQRRAVAKGKDASAYQKFEDGRWWRQVTAPEAHYDGEKDMLDLLGDSSKRQVHLKNSIGDDIKAITATLSTKEDQTEDDEYKKFKLPIANFVDRGDSDDPRGAPDKKATEPPKTPPTKTGGP